MSGVDGNVVPDGWLRIRNTRLVAYLIRKGFKCGSVIHIHNQLMRAAKSKKEGAKEAASMWTWQKESTLIYGDCGSINSAKVASFDMDDTLIKVKSGAKFPKNADDWLFWHASVPDKLRELAKEGYKLVIFTNQNGISKGHTVAADIQTKIQNICKEVGVEMLAFIASADDEYRKPSTKMWELPKSLSIDGSISASIYD